MCHEQFVFLPLSTLNQGKVGHHRLQFTVDIFYTTPFGQQAACVGIVVVGLFAGQQTGQFIDTQEVDAQFFSTDGCTLVLRQLLHHRPHGVSLVAIDMFGSVQHLTDSIGLCAEYATRGRSGQYQ